MFALKQNCVATKLFCILLLCASSVFADYVEGLDTTDLNGYGLDSAFRMSNEKLTGQIVVIYHKNTATGYFNYSFDDIKMAPDSIIHFTGYAAGDSNLSVLTDIPPKPLLPYQIENFCFIVKNNHDSTYSKVQILSKFSSNHYIFKYGKNTKPNNPLLDKASYNKSLLYKPNNFFNYYQYRCYSPDPSENYSRLCGENTSFWKAPIPNNNHLLGYIFYIPKSTVFIDTSKPINIAQWDSIAFISSTSFSRSMQVSQVPSGYFNLVAVYSEGKSDFLQGWTKGLVNPPINVKPITKNMEKSRSNLRIVKLSNGFFITFNSIPKLTGSSSLFIYNLIGTKVAVFSNIQEDHVFLNPKSRNLAPGQYFVKMELSDKRVMNGRFVF